MKVRSELAEVSIIFESRIGFVHGIIDSPFAPVPFGEAIKERGRLDFLLYAVSVLEDVIESDNGAEIVISLAAVSFLDNFLSECEDTS